MVTIENLKICELFIEISSHFVYAILYAIGVIINAPSKSPTHHVCQLTKILSFETIEEKYNAAVPTVALVAVDRTMIPSPKIKIV